MGFSLCGTCNRISIGYCCRSTVDIKYHDSRHSTPFFFFFDCPTFNSRKCWWRKVKRFANISYHFDGIISLRHKSTYGRCVKCIKCQIFDTLSIKKYLSIYFICAKFLLFVSVPLQIFNGTNTNAK